MGKYEPTNEGLYRRSTFHHQAGSGWSVMHDLLHKKHFSQTTNGYVFLPLAVVPSETGKCTPWMFVTNTPNVGGACLQGDHSFSTMIFHDFSMTKK